MSAPAKQSFLAKVRLWWKLRSAQCRAAIGQWFLLRMLDPNAKKVVVIMTQGGDGVTGGLMCLCSIYEEVRRMKKDLGCEVAFAILPGHPNRWRYTRFKNRSHLLPLTAVLRRFRNAEQLLLEVGDNHMGDFLNNATAEDWALLRGVPSLRINILLLNILLLKMEHLERFRALGPVTCTTAHEKYSGPDTAARLGVPVFKMSTNFEPEQYEKRSHAAKENLLVVSPDLRPEKEEILRGLAREFPQLEIVIVQNMKYEDYRRLILRARWSLTFGEGLDYYLLEEICTGGIGFAVYNEDFFTPDFAELPTVYGSYEELREKMAADLRRLDNAEAFARENRRQYELVRKYYGYDRYVANLRRFHEWALNANGAGASQVQGQLVMPRA